MIFLNNFLYKNTGEVSCNISEFRNIKFPDNLLFRRFDLFNIVAEHLLKHYRIKIRNRSIFMISFIIIALSHLLFFSIEDSGYYALVVLYYFFGIICWIVTALLLINDKINRDEVVTQYKRLQYNMSKINSSNFNELEFRMSYFMYETYHITLDIPSNITDRIIDNYRVYESRIYLKEK